jgi:glycosyltransferase involved in cell wall biosynthesis
MSVLAKERLVVRPATPPLPPLVVDGRVIQDRYHGIGRQTFELVRALVERGVEVDLLVGDAPSARLSPLELPAAANLRLVPTSGEVVSLRDQPRWSARLRGLRGRILVVPYHLAAPWFAPLPRATFVHDCIFEEHPAFAPAAGRLRYRLATRAAIARSAAVLTVSEATRRAIGRVYGVDVEPTGVVRSGVDPSFAEPVDADAVAALRARHGLERPYVLHVGARRPHKNQVVLVQAVAELARRGLDVDLVLVGERDSRVPDPVGEELAARPSLRARVHELQTVDERELRVLYAGAAVFGFPSYVEGYGLPVLEAMRAGVPVVASTAAAVAEAAAGAALLVDPADRIGWADALAAVLENGQRAAELRAEGRRVASAATWQRTADDFARALQPLVSRVTS